MCTGNGCGGTYGTDRYAGVCDPDGCDFNSYRMGDKTFYGPGMTIDTKTKLTVVTQFLKGSDGNLSEIKRFYVQNGKVIPNSESKISGVTGNSITQKYCDAQKVAFGDNDSFKNKGGLAQMGKALAQPMVLVLSIWDDHAANMLWLDSTYPVDSNKPGAARGSCATTSGVPKDVEAQAPDSTVVYSNIKFGPINSTFSATGTGSNPPTTTTNPPTNGGGNGATAGHWEQCGGIDWKGATQCASGLKCTVLNDWYYQCL